MAGEVHSSDPASNTDRFVGVGQPVGTVVPRRSGGAMVAVSTALPAWTSRAAR